MAAIRHTQEALEKMPQTGEAHFEGVKDGIKQDFNEEGLQILYNFFTRNKPPGITDEELEYYYKEEMDEEAALSLCREGMARVMQAIGDGPPRPVVPPAPVAEEANGEGDPDPVLDGVAGDGEDGDAPMAPQVQEAVGNPAQEQVLGGGGGVGDVQLSMFIKVLSAEVVRVWGLRPGP